MQPHENPRLGAFQRLPRPNRDPPERQNFPLRL